MLGRTVMWTKCAPAKRLVKEAAYKAIIRSTGDDIRKLICWSNRARSDSTGKKWFKAGCQLTRKYGAGLSPARASAGVKTMRAMRNPA